MDVLVIRGAFAGPRQMMHLPSFLPGVDVAFRDLDGDGGRTVAGFAQEVDAALERPTVVVGVSLGGLVALALRSPWLRGVLALDPPLLSTDLPQWLREGLPRQGDPAFARAMFGIGDDAGAARDYRGLLRNLPAPTTLMAGSEPESGPRSGAIGAATFREIPQAVRALRVAGSGHDLIEGAGALILAELQALLGSADGRSASA